MSLAVSGAFLYLAAGASFAEDDASIRIKSAVALVGEARVAEKQRQYLSTEKTLKRALEQLSDTKEEKLLRASILHDASRSLRSQMKYREAENVLTEALLIYQENLGANSRQAGDVMNSLGLVLAEEDRCIAAVSVFEKCWELTQKEYPASSSRAIAVRSNLARAQVECGNIEAARAIWKELLAMLKSSKLSDDEQFVFYDSYGNYLRSIKQSSDAAINLENARKIAEPRSGEQPSDSIVVLEDLAKLYESKGQFDQAVQTLQEVLKIKETAYGADSEYAIVTLDNLATNLCKHGKYEEGLRMFNRSLKLTQDKFGSGHPLSARSLNGLAMACQEMKRYKESEEYFQQALAVSLDSNGEGVGGTAGIRRNLGLLYMDMKRYSDAFPLMKQAFETRKEIMGEQNQYTADGYGDMGLYCEWTGDFDQAEPNFKKALAIYTRLKGADCEDAQVINMQLTRLEKYRQMMKRQNRTPSEPSMKRSASSY